MITLHGFSYSNYYNIVKHVLLYKGLPFEEDLQFGSADEYRTVSPLGKVPALSTEAGEHLSESSVCCDYLEEAYPDSPALYPADPYARAHVRQIMKVSELYLELAARRLIPFALSNTDAPKVVSAEVSETLQRGVDAMNALCSFAQFAAGAKVTMADIYLRYVLDVVALASGKLGEDFVSKIHGITPWQATMADTDAARRVDADKQANGPAFFAYIKERYGM